LYNTTQKVEVYASFSTGVRRAGFVDSPFTAQEMQGFAQLLAVSPDLDRDLPGGMPSSVVMKHNRAPREQPVAWPGVRDVRNLAGGVRVAVKIGVHSESKKARWRSWRPTGVQIVCS
jgi:hypothetical protein